MKNWIAIAAIAVSFAFVTQNGKGHDNKDQGNKGKSKLSINLDQNKNKGKSNKQQAKPNKQQAKPSKQQGKSGKSKVKVNPKKPKSVNKGNGNKGVFHPGNKGPKGKSAKFHYKKGHANHIYMYSYGPIHYPTKNYGQWRSRQARNKHQQYRPTLEIDAHNAIIMISDRNAFLHVEIGNKIDRYERLVIERHNAGLITDVQFSAHRVKIKHYRQTHVQYNFYV